MKSGIIEGALSFKENLCGADTLDPQLQQVERLTGKLAETTVRPMFYAQCMLVFILDRLVKSLMLVFKNIFVQQFNFISTQKIELNIKWPIFPIFRDHSFRPLGL